MKLSSLLSGSLVVTSVVVGASLAVVKPASAASVTTTKSSYNWKPGDSGAGVNNRIGIHEQIKTTYTTKTQGDQTLSQTFTWKSVFSQTENGDLPNGGWLVISDGPNPKNHEKEFAIFYLDGVNKKVTAYAYNGQNNSGSYQNNPFLRSWDNALKIRNDGDQRTIKFSVDVSGINARTDIDDAWKGVKFGEDLGIWFHAAKDVNATYNENGSLASFGSTAGWFDTGRLDARVTTSTKEVPEPITGTIAAVSALGMGSTLKKRMRKQK